MRPNKWVIPGIALAAAAATPSVRGADAGAWERMRLPGYASARAFASVPAGLLAGTDSGGIYLTVSEGADWTQVWKAPTKDMVEPIRIFLPGDSVLLAASGSAVNMGMWDCWSLDCVSPAGKGGMLRSRDGGKTWAYAGLRAVTAMARLGGANILAATLSGFYRSPDWGATWRPVSVMPDPGTALTPDAFKSLAVGEMASLQGDAYFTMSSPGLHRLYLPSPIDSVYRVQTVLSEATSVTGAGDTLFACTPAALLRATFRGWPASGWESLSPSAFARIVPAPGRLLAIPPPVPAYGDFSAAIRQSIDGGRTWSAASPPGTEGLAFIQHKKALYWGSRGGHVLRCAQGGEWTYASDGLQDMRVTRIALSKSSILAVLEDYTLLHHGPGPAGAWTLSHRGYGLGTLASRDREAAFLAGGYMWSSPQAGAPGSWDTSVVLRGARSLVAGEGWRLVLQSEGQRTLCGAGTCQDPLSGDLPAERYNGLYYNNALHASAVAGDTVYLALDSLYRSCDRGRAFEFLSSVRPRALAVSGGNLEAIKVYALGDSGDWPNRTHLAVSADGGRNWRHDPETGIRGPGTLRLLASRPGELFCAGDSGVFARRDGQTAWTDLSEGLPSRKIRALAAEGDRLAVAADDGPVWLRTLEPLPTAARAAPGARSRAGRPPAGSRAFRDGSGHWRRLDGSRESGPRAGEDP